jgi:hypothetical protein
LQLAQRALSFGLVLLLGAQAMSAARTRNVRSGSASSVNRTQNVNRNANVNRNYNQNVNVNRNVNVNVDRDVDVHYHGGYHYGGGCCYNDHPVAVAAAVTATAMVTAAVIGSVVNTLPPSCSSVIVGGIAYQRCGSSWYQPQMSGANVTYIVVNPPN